MKQTTKMLLKYHEKTNKRQTILHRKPTFEKYELHQNMDNIWLLRCYTGDTSRGNQLYFLKI